MFDTWPARLHRFALAGIAGLGACVLLQADARAQSPLTAIAETGRPAAGTEPGTTFDRIQGMPVINAAGEVVFISTLAGPGVTAANGNALWTYTGGAPQVAVRAGDHAPGA